MIVETRDNVQLSFAAEQLRRLAIVGKELFEWARLTMDGIHQNSEGMRTPLSRRGCARSTVLILASILGPKKTSLDGAWHACCRTIGRCHAKIGRAETEAGLQGDT